MGAADKKLLEDRVRSPSLGQPAAQRRAVVNHRRNLFPLHERGSIPRHLKDCHPARVRHDGMGCDRLQHQRFSRLRRPGKDETPEPARRRHIGRFDHVGRDIRAEGLPLTRDVHPHVAFCRFGDADARGWSQRWQCDLQRRPRIGIRRKRLNPTRSRDRRAAQISHRS